MKRKSDSLGPMLPKDRPKRLYDLSAEAGPGAGLAAAAALIAVNAFLMVKNLLYGDKAAQPTEEASARPSDIEEGYLSFMNMGSAPAAEEAGREESRPKERTDEEKPADATPKDNLIHLVRQPSLIDAGEDSVQFAPEIATTFNIPMTASAVGRPEPGIAIQPGDTLGNASQRAATSAAASSGGGRARNSDFEAQVQRQKESSPANTPNSLALLFAPVCLGTLLSEQASALTLETLLDQAQPAGGDADLAITRIEVSAGSLLQLADGEWTYRAPEDFYGEITLRYTVASAEEAVEMVAYGLVVPDDHPAVTGSGRIYEGTATAHLGAISNTIYGTDHNDILTGTPAADLVHAGKGNDIVYGLGGNDVIHGEQGHDVLFGGAGQDHIYGGEDNDIVFGDAGDDLLDGGEGNDFVDGGEGNDIVIGCDGNDVLKGGTGRDILYGGVGEDTLIAGEDDDIIAAGADNDLIIASHQDGDDEIDGGDGVDTLDLSNTAASAVVDLQNGYASSAEIGRDKIKNIEHVIGSSEDDRIIVNDSVNLVFGGNGDDIFEFKSLDAVQNEHAGRDIIGDFSVGDRIDLAFFGTREDDPEARDFTLVLDANADVDGPHLRYRFEENDENEYRTIIEGYLDADGNPDFEIEVLGQYHFTNRDFIGLDPEHS